MNTILVWSNNHFWLTIGLSAVFAFILSQVWIALFVYCICGSMPATFPTQQSKDGESV